MVFLVSYISGCRKTFYINNPKITQKEILQVLEEKEGTGSDVVLQSNGRILACDSSVPNNSSVVATLRLYGGKGGFGSMLRAIGAQIEKTTNREACRDLSGRRLRDINEEKRLKEFISKRAERERELLESKRQKFEKLKDTPKHIFQDVSYYQQRELREKNLFDSLDKAFSKEKNGGPSGIKRKPEIEAKQVPLMKKRKFLDDLDESSDEDSEENTDTKSKNGASSGEVTSSSDKTKEKNDDRNEPCSVSSSRSTEARSSETSGGTEAKVVLSSVPANDESASFGEVSQSKEELVK